MTDFEFSAPWLLVLLPLALLPWWSRRRDLPRHAWVALLPKDRLSDAIGLGLKLLATIALAATVIGLAGPYRGPTTVTRVGEGAEIAILFDRSRSMDLPFTNNSSIGNRAETSGDSKGRVARELLLRFTAARPFDEFAMFIFSARPMRALDFTSSPEAIRAAITANDVGRGLGETDIGTALEAGVAAFESRPYLGARVILLVSDGGARLDPDVRHRLTDGLQRVRARVYWLYIRSVGSATIRDSAGLELSEAIPEVALHRFLESTGVPYRAFEAEDPKELGRAIEDIDRLEKHTIVTTAVAPRRELAGWWFAIAAGCVGLLALARVRQRESWGTA
ncbi:MAG: VWA domain-containing protein [Burkholderiales bacterium]|nr:VWA domain-containing protein [Burkholderiales bacterium]